MIVVISALGLALIFCFSISVFVLLYPLASEISFRQPASISSYLLFSWPSYCLFLILILTISISPNPTNTKFFNNSQPIPPAPTTRIFEVATFLKRSSKNWAGISVSLKIISGDSSSITAFRGWGHFIIDAGVWEGEEEFDRRREWLWEQRSSTFQRQWRKRWRYWPRAIKFRSTRT